MSTSARKLVANSLIVCLSLLISLAGLELLVRAFGTVDGEGNFGFAGTTLRPYQLPLADTAQIVAEYAQSDRSRLQYDPKLGWSPRPNSVSRDGLYHYNGQGIRSAPTAYSPTPPPGVLRIALFGDSYTHGDDVVFEDSWGYLLEQNLREAGLEAEVLNFGVSGYGMDQAYLRWQTYGRGFAADVVIFGLDAENVYRNVNLIRAIYKPATGLPFAKPRFLLTPNDLEVINVPVLPPDQLVPVMQNIDTWELAPHEYFLVNYEDSLWLKSKLLAFLLTPSEAAQDARMFDPAGEPAQLSLRIVSQFREEVEADGHRFVVLHLPRQSNVETVLAGERLEYADLLATVARENSLIDPQPALSEAARRTSLTALFKGHYSPAGSGVLADFIADYLLANDLAHLAGSS